MKRILILSLCILAGSHAPFAEAQLPEACSGNYAGSYEGDFSGNLRGAFGVNDPGFCGPQSLGAFSIAFEGSFAQFFWQDVTRTQVSTVVCVLDDLSFEGKGSATAGGNTREFFVSGNMDLNTCTISGTWTMHGLAGGFTMSLAPRALQVFWNALNGDFSNTSNWIPQEVPGTGQIAVFNQNQSFAVSFGNASSGGFLMERGDITFLTGSYTATGGSEAAPSAVIGNTSDATILHLTSHHLATAFSTLALTPTSPAEVFVEGGSTWTEQGRMIVGQGGLAYLNIRDNASVTSMETQIGAEASANGTVNVSQEIPLIGATAEWTTGSIAIGLRGKGTVNHFGGNIYSHSVVVGVEEGSQGTVTVGSAGNSAVWYLDESPLTVGARGEGQLDIVAGGYIFVNAIIQVVVGQSEGSFGTVRIDGASSELYAPGSFVVVGSDGSGSMSLRNGGKVTCGIGIIDSDGIVLIDNSNWECLDFSINDSGRVLLNNGTLEASESFDIRPGGTIEGNGYVDTPDADVEGTVAPGVAIEPPKGLPNQGESIGTLTFGGNVNFGSATLEIEVGGLAEGNYDVIHATGAVDIQNSTVVFSFIEGFLPQTGDTVPFLVADAGVMIANLAMEFEGVAEGFQFEVTEENGMLVFEALNDAQPIPIPSADLNKDGEIDFIDLLIFIEQMNSQP